MTTQRKPLMDISSNDVMSTPVTNIRRKSGRAVKLPEKFVPDAPSSQAGAVSTKRKRGGEDVENDASDLDEGEEDSDEDIESSEEEEVKETRRKTKKPMAKKPKPNGTASHDEAPAVKLPARPKKATKRVFIADDSTDGLYADIFTSGQSIRDVAQKWLNQYAENNPAALTEMVNFLLKSAGCPIQVTEDDINDTENVDGKLGDLQTEYQAQNIIDYPLISKLKSNHSFRSSFAGFWDQLIEAMHDSGIMYQDASLMEHVHLWVATMSSSTSRPFRHTATVAALAMASAMCRVAHKEIDLAAGTLRLYEGEQKRKGTNKARLADFKQKVANNDKNKVYIESQMKDLFDTVYVHRYRDVDPRIRLECVEALGNWILTLRSYFFEAQFLRYMGWLLSDTHGPMRQEVLRQLSKVMKVKENHGGMRHFIERFRPRLVEMATRDSESGVRAAAVELIDLIRQAGFLEPDDIDTIGKLIFDSELKIRKSLVGFFAENIKDFYEAKVDELGGEALEEILTVKDEDDFDTPRAGWVRFKCLAEILLSYDADDQDEMPSQVNADPAGFLNVSGFESRFTLAAQALYDKIPDLKDWEVLTGYLLFDHTSRPTGNETERALKEAFRPNEREELVLLEILNAIVKLNLTHADDLDKTKDKNKKRQTKTETTKAMENTARHLAALIPKLLKKYGADPKTATVVLRLEHYLNLGVFQELRQDTTYGKLLDEISAQFSGHSDQGVLNEAGAAFLHARGYEELEEVTENKVQSLWEDTTSILRKLSKGGNFPVRGTLRNKALNELSQTLKRIEKLASISSCVEHLEAENGKTDTLPITLLLDIVARGVFEESNDEVLDALEDEVVVSAIRSVMFYFMWKMRELLDFVSSGEKIAELDIENLRELQDKFIINLTAAFSSRSTLDPVRLLGAGTLLDIHTLFARLRPSKKGKEAAIGEEERLQTLIREIDPAVQRELTSIFDGLEKQFAKRSKKRLAEPSETEEPVDFEDEPEDDEDGEDSTASGRQSETLRAEQQLCELTGKLVLAIVAQVIDVSGPLKGKLRIRIQRNCSTLGPNFKEIVGYLDENRSKGKKSHKSKAQQAANAAKQSDKGAKSSELVEDDEDEDPFADVEPEEGTVEDLRRRELLDEEPSVLEDGEALVEDVEEEEDEVMGD